MKLLLTSMGISTKAMAGALQKMVGKPMGKIKIGFIPTAANVVEGQKDWFVEQLTALQKYGFAWIDVVDPSADGVNWKRRLKDVDMVYVSGGNTFYLLDQLRKTGLGKWLKANLAKKVYVGASAGSIVAGPNIACAGIEPADDNLPGLKDLTGLKLVDFEFSPHTFAMTSEAAVKKYAKNVTNKFYAVNDKSAIQVINGKVKVIHVGRYLEFN